MDLKNLFLDCAYKVHYESTSGHVNYAFKECDDTLYIYFQGSEDIRKPFGWIDWLRNFWFFPITN